MKRIWLVFLVLSLGLGGLWWVRAQQQESEVPPPEKIGVYDPNFKYIEGRDPFENLTIKVEQEVAERTIQDVSDLLVEEVQILGVYQRGGKYYAIVRGAGLKKSSSVTVGQKFYNGEIIDIQPKVDRSGRRQLCVIFRQRTDDPIRPFIRVERCVQR